MKRAIMAYKNFSYYTYPHRRFPSAFNKQVYKRNDMLNICTTSIAWVPVIQDLQLLAQGSGLARNFLSNSCSKIVIQLNICHRFFCIVMIYNFLVFLYAIIFSHYHNAVYSSIKHDYYPFPLVFKSPTFGQLGRPLPEEPFFTLSKVTVFWKGHLTCFMLVTFFPTPFEFLFPFLVWTYNNSEVTLLSDIKQRPVFSNVQIFFCLGLLPHPMPNINVLTRQSLS